MKKFLFNLGLLTMAVILMAAITWVGCSDTPTSTETTKDISSQSLTSYFPLSGNSNLDFEVIDYVSNDTTRQRYAVGSANEFSSTQTVYGWISYDVEHPYFVDTGYFCLDNGVLYYYSNLYMRPEAILSTPFEVGKTWARYTTTKGLLDSGTVIDLNYDYEVIKYDNGSGDDYNGLNDYNPYGIGENDNNGDGSYKNFPSSGSNSYEITAVETVTLKSGTSYNNCICVGSTNGDYHYNYWYAPGVGLIKYVLGQDQNDYPNGRVVGEKVPGWNY